MVFIRVGSRNLPRRSYRSQIVLVLDSSGCGSSFPPESWELLLRTSPTISLCSGGAGEVRNTFICERKSSNIVGIVGITSLFDFFVRIIIKRYCRPLWLFLLRPLIMVITKKSDNNISASKDIQAMVSCLSGKSYLFPSFSLCYPFP